MRKVRPEGFDTCQRETWVLGDSTALVPWETPIVCSELEGECSNIDRSCCQGAQSNLQVEVADLMDPAQRFPVKGTCLLVEY